MQVTPLRFLPNKDDEPWYGISIYDTNCRRFQIGKYQEGWMVEESWESNTDGFDSDWNMWLTYIGLFNAQFPTRRAAVAALIHALEVDDLMDSLVPPQIT